MPLARRLLIIFCKSSTAMGSIPENGSSSKINVGLMHRQRAISTRRRSPPDRAYPRFWRITELAQGQYSLVTVSIRASVHEERFVIEAAKEKWANRRIGSALPERMDWTDYLFQLEGDLVTEETWLVQKEQRRSAFQCAEFLLFDALGE